MKYAEGSLQVEQLIKAGNTAAARACLEETVKSPLNREEKCDESAALPSWVSLSWSEITVL